MEYQDLSRTLLLYVLAWIIIFWFVLPCHVANIARQKGYSYWQWLFTTPFLNILALLIVIGLKDINTEFKNHVHYEELQKINKNLERLISITENDAKVREIISKM